MSDFNDIGISRQLDWARIKKLLSIGLFASLLHLVGDFILGWGVEDETLSGLFRMLSAYTSTPDGALFASALLGLFGVTLEGLSFFGVYRLIAARSPEYAHRYRSGIFGYVIFCGCGYHVSFCALTFLMKHGVALELLRQYLVSFVYAPVVLFFIFFLVLVITQIQAFAKGLTPYPRWCWVFCIPVGSALALIPNVLGNHPLANALSCAWLAVGNLWMFGGLLANLPAAQRKHDN